MLYRNNMQDVQKGFTFLVLGIIVVALIVTSGAAYILIKQQQEVSQAGRDPQITTPNAEQLTVEKLLNVTYSPGLESVDQTFTFKDGIHYFKYLEGKGGSNQISQYPDPDYYVAMSREHIVFGDVNGDTKDDAVVVMGERYGGTGYFKYLAVFINNNGVPQYIDSKDLGDRTIIKTVKIEDGIIIADLITHSSEDPMCCPTKQETIWLKLSDNQLLNTTTQPTSMQPTSADQGIEGLKYRNEIYGFEFLFDEGYRNIWMASGGEDNDRIEGYDHIRFFIKNAPNPDIFIIDVYNKKWFLDNAIVLDNKDTFRKGEERSLSSALGIYLGENDEFVFTLWPNNQSCPDLADSGPGPLCALTEGKSEMVSKSFKIIGK